MPSIQLFRSILYTPGANLRVMRKAAGLGADALILDLEDAVAPQAKVEARENIVLVLREGAKGGGDGVRRTVRINALSSNVWQADLAAVVPASPAAIVVPKVESSEGLEEVEAEMARHEAAAGIDPLPIWAMIESPLGVLNAYEIARRERVTCLLMGTNDLAEALRAPFGKNRSRLRHALSQVVLAARAANVAVIDGVFVNLQDAVGFDDQCKEGVRWGFDGKSLIHPRQIEPANQAFAPSDKQVARAKRVLKGWKAAQEKGEEICLVDGKLVERLHARDAERILRFAGRIPPE